MRPFPLLLGAAFLPALAQAQTAAPPTSTPSTPPDIIVLGRGLDVPPGTTAYGSVVIDRERLTNDASGRIEDVLQDVAGLQQFRRSDSRSANPSAQGVTLRALGGNATSRALVLLDGVPQADPFFGYIPFNAIVPGRLGAVRVTRGGGAGAFGAGAVAGTIELESASRADLPLIDGSALYGSRNAQEVTAAFAPNLGAGYLAASGRFERGDGFYTTPADQRGPADVRARYRDYSVSLRGVAPIDADTELQARTLLFRDERTLRFRGADSSSDGEDASIRLIHHGTWAIDALAYVQARNFTNKVISSTSYKLALDQRSTPSTGVGGKIELRPPVGAAHVLRFGVDVRQAQGALREDAYSTATGSITATRHAGGDTATLGAFIEDDWTLERLILTGGARADRWTITDGFFEERDPSGALTTDNRFGNRHGVAGSGRVGAVFTATPGVKLRAAAYTGFRVPTLNELYRPFTVFPILTQANAALRLEKLRGAEIGVDLTPLRGITLGLTAFDNRLDDAIANVTLTPVLRQRQNVDAIEARGIEATAQLSHGPWLLDASYAFNDAHVQASGIAAALDGKIPAQSPRHAASATLAYRPAAGLVLSTTLRYVGKQYEDDLETNVLPSATTLDAVAELPITRRVSIVGRAENVFNETVVTRNAAGSIDLGTPRTLWIGIRLR
jgi:outer membrane receptor protein involved in Fe transport